MQTVVDKVTEQENGTTELPTSPVTMQELELLKQTITFDSDDVKNLRMAGELLEDQTESIVNLWRGLINSMPHLACYFKDANGNPNEEYKAKVKERFRQWIMEVCTKPFDQDWLNRQYEIGKQYFHAPAHIPMRYIMAFTAVVNDTIKPFLARKVQSLGVIEKMHKAWCKAVLLHLTLWTRAYCPDAEW